jgi:hypothetical protein
VQCTHFSILHVVDEIAYGGSQSSVYCFVVDEKACGRRKETVVHRMICGRRKPYGRKQISAYLFIVEKRTHCCTVHQILQINFVLYEGE